MTEVDIQVLAREIAARMAPDALLDIDDVAALLKCSARYVAEQYVPLDGFPKSIRLVGPSGRKGQPRWQRSDIIEWVQSHRHDAKKPGRPRKAPLN